MKKLIISAGLVLYSLFGCINSSFGQDIVDPSTLDNKIMAGYQGWFAAEGDGSGVGWRHWGSGNTMPGPESITIDYWPDMREYESDELFETNFSYPDGSNGLLYSAYTPKTVDRHVKWMKDYGIDGVFVQRFIGNTLSILELRDQVLQNVRYASEKHGRVFANMYDISGGNPETLVENLKTDWMHLVDDLNITKSPNYLHHNGRPVLSIWGLGIRTEFSAASAREIIQWFTMDAPDKYLVTLKGGIDNLWQSHSAEWQEIYEMFDILSPWSVGRYRDNAGADNFRNNRIEPDLIRTQSLNIDYMPVVFPGFSWFNNKGGDNVLNAIPRNGGSFLWHQMYNAVDAGCNMVYVAMYDEVDEGTAIYKLAESIDQTPVETAFVTLDMDGIEIPSDWYLRLTAEGTKMLRGEIPVTSTMPITPTINHSTFISQNVSTVVDPGATISVSITVQNTGKTTWTKADGFSLGSQKEQDNMTWGINRVELDEGEMIAPGESKTFVFDITAPSTENIYNFQWRMTQAGVNWFGDFTINRLINVGSNVVIFDDCDALTDWNSSGTMILNGTDHQQGNGCLEFTGDVSQEYSKVYTNPYYAGITAANAVLQFWYYISDASSLGTQCKIELGSSGKAGEDAYSWMLEGLSTGWNLINVKIEDASMTGTPDLNAINWFSIENPKSGSITTRIDEIQILDMNASATKYNLTVNNGTGSGDYIHHAKLNIHANDAPEGYKFSKWVIIAGNPSISDLSAKDATLIMPREDAEITATYKVTMNYLDDCDEDTDWNDANLIELNSSDQQQGTGCLEFTGGGPGETSREFYKSFSSSYNSGVTEADGVLQFWYYISDISQIGSSNQIELGSGGIHDVDEYSWKLDGRVSDGWNLLNLKISDAGKIGNPDLNAINWFRIYDQKSGPVTSRIDAIKLLGSADLDKHTLLVHSGTGSGIYVANEMISITANEAPEGMRFDRWSVDSGGDVIEDLLASSTMLTMPSGDVSVTANYTDILPVFTLTVNDGIGSGDYIENQEVEISAYGSPVGKGFDSWRVDSGGAAIANINSATTTLTMPAADAVVTATYNDIPGPYILTVEGGSGSGNYHENQEVEISADPAPEGMEFDRWVISSDEPNIIDVNQATTTLTMPATHVAVSATYKDIITGLPEFVDNSRSIRIFPNPSNALFHIEVPSSIQQATYHVHNILGGMVKSGRLKGEQTKISLRGSKKGLYTVHVTTQSRVFVERIVIE